MHLSIGRPYFQTDFGQDLTNTLKALSCKAFAMRDEKMLKICRARVRVWRGAKRPPQHRRRQMNGTRLKSFFDQPKDGPDPGRAGPERVVDRMRHPDFSRKDDVRARARGPIDRRRAPSEDCVTENCRGRLQRKIHANLPTIHR
jgi:hypothetical protein